MSQNHNIINSIRQEDFRMSLPELLIIAVGLSMDAFAVSICKGLSMNTMSWKNAVAVGLYFGGFQALMPALGYLLGSRFREAISSIDHWIAFILLILIGLNMVKESRSQEVECTDCSIAPANMILLAVATSIDALAVGVTFGFLNVRIVNAVSTIGCITLLLSVAGVKTGHVFGVRYKSRAELAGGAILILMGSKILMEHLFF